MSEARKPYVTFSGTVQAFTKDGVKQPAVTRHDSNNQARYTLTVRTPTQALLGLTLWSEHAHVADKIQEGYALIGEGTYSESQGQNGQTYKNVSVTQMAVIPCVQKQERDVVNPVQPVAQASQETVQDAAPTAPTSVFQF